MGRGCVWQGEGEGRQVLCFQSLSSPASTFSGTPVLYTELLSKVVFGRQVSATEKIMVDIFVSEPK